jgi:hypothetical protein
MLPELKKTAKSKKKFLHAANSLSLSVSQPAKAACWEIEKK